MHENQFEKFLEHIENTKLSTEKKKRFQCLTKEHFELHGKYIL